MGDNVLDFSNFTGLAGDSFKIKQTWTRVDNERSESPKVKFCEKQQISFFSIICYRKTNVFSIVSTVGAYGDSSS